MCAKPAKNWALKDILQGKTAKTIIFKVPNRQSGLLAGPDFGNMKTLIQTFGRILKI